MKGIRFLDGTIGYLNIPKTASTSIMHEIFRLEEGAVYDGKGSPHNYINKKHSGDIGDCEFKFIVVRDPVKRFLSFYGNRVTHYNELSQSRIEENSPTLVNDIPYFDPSLDQFIESYSTYSMVGSKGHHTKPLLYFLEGMDLSYFDCVYPIENILALETDLSTKCERRVSFGLRQLGGDKLKLSKLSSSQMDFLVEYYKEDYVLLDGFYTVDNIWREWGKKRTFVKRINGVIGQESEIGQEQSVGNNEENLSTYKEVTDSPFIVWTFRRTGGTNLSNTLFDLSPHDSMQHEPFNLDRIFGSVTKNWRESGDRDALYRAIDEILSTKINIKHCLEIIPNEVNQALLDISMQYGYRHVFLYRENPADRLLSLNYAMATGVWGKDQKESTEIDDDVFKIAIDVDHLMSHENMSRRKMMSIYNRLVELKAEPLAISFEALYSASFEYGSTLVRSLYARLGLNTESLNDTGLKKLLTSGAQGSKSEYKKFPRSEEFVREARKFPVFSLQKRRNLLVTPTSEGLGMQCLQVWNLLPGIDREHYILSGVCNYLDWKNGDELFLKVAGEKVAITTGLNSPRIEKLYPESGNSSCCRFISNPFRMCVNAELYLSREGQESTLLAALRMS